MFYDFLCFLNFFYIFLLYSITCSNTSSQTDTANLAHFYYVSKVFEFFKVRYFCKSVNLHYFSKDI